MKGPAAGVVAVPPIRFRRAHETVRNIQMRAFHAHKVPPGGLALTIHLKRMQLQLNSHKRKKKGGMNLHTALLLLLLPADFLVPQTQPICK